MRPQRPQAGSLLGVARAIPPLGLSAGLALLTAAYIAAHIVTAKEFELGASLTSPTVATCLLLALAAALCWSFGGRVSKTIAVIALLLAAEGLLRIRTSLGIAEGPRFGASELAAAAIFLVATVWRCRWRWGALPLSELGPRLARFAGGLTMAVPYRAAALTLAGVCAVLIGVGALVALSDLPLPEFDMEEEISVDSWITTALFAAAASLAVLRARVAGESRWWLVLAAVLAIAAIDEPHGLHDRPEYHTGQSATVLFLPLVIVAGVAWLRALALLSAGHARHVFVAGGILWLVAVALDPVVGGDPLRVFEEACEITASSCLLLGLLADAQDGNRTGQRRLVAV